MHIALWVAQVILSLIFIGAGWMKLNSSKDKLREKIGGWVNDFSPSQLKIIGILEITGGLGMVFPMLLDLLPVLTPIAAACLALDMVMASLVHAKRHEYRIITINFVIMGLCLFVALNRF